MKGVFILKKENIKGRNWNRKVLTAAAVILIAGICCALIFIKFAGGEQNVNFEVYDKNMLPREITADIIPEYKTLERALACKAEDGIYVVVTRGEKPTSGFDVSVSKITLEEKDGKKNLIVYAEFKDPDKKTALSQIITYPVAVVKTELKTLPDSIELRIQY